MTNTPSTIQVSIRSVCVCMLEFHLGCVRLLTLSFIMSLMWLSGARLHTKLLLTVPALASSSAFSLPNVSCLSFYPFKLYCIFVCKFGECFMVVSDGFVVVYFIILFERACSADRLLLQNVICWLLKVISSSAACLMAAVLAWKTVQ